MTINRLAGDDDDLGFSFPSRFRGGGGRGPRYLAPPAPRRGAAAAVPRQLVVPPGGVAPQAGVYPVPMPTFTFTNATGLATITSTINPQVNFRAQRMMVLVQRLGGAVAIPLLVRGQVGIKQMLLSPDPLPIEIFSNVSVDANVTYPQTRPGNTYSMTLGMATALGVGESVNVLITFLGTAYQ